MLESFIRWLLDRFRDLGYPGIVVLMAIESSVLPLPSELVMPPAGYLAAKGEMDFWVAIACGVLGSVLGALASYGLATWLGRPLLLRLGRYVRVSETGLARSERYFAAHGEISTFLARLLPVARHLISLPAGLARMNLARFVTFTALGALAWCTVLTCHRRGLPVAAAATAPGPAGGPGVAWWRPRASWCTAGCRGWGSAGSSGRPPNGWDWAASPATSPTARWKW